MYNAPAKNSKHSIAYTI